MEPARMAGVIARGAAAGVAASVAQAALGKSYEKLLLPPGEDSDLAPRLVRRIAERAGERVSHAEKWALGTAFHLGYGAFWGAGYAAARERWPVPPLAGGALLGGFIYVITFPRWGGAVRTGVVRPPDRRSDRMTAFGALVTLAFGVMTALAYEGMRAPDARDGGAGGPG
ncbi:MAG TPA: hypothetical protein VGR37_03370 [Longimicrobiaceae bacterium]|nr:hypothetical protein [Longimicrobiaceae bacterium]